MRHQESEAPSTEMMPSADALYVEVIVDARTKVPGDRFTYAAPPGLGLRPGHLVRVPFGQRALHGVVVRLTHELHVDYVKPVLGLLHPEPVIDEAHLALAGWIAEHYMASLFDALAPMLPPGLRGRARTVIVLRDGVVASGELADGAKRLLAHLQSSRRPHPLAALTRNLGPWVPNAVRALAEAGLIEERVSDQLYAPAHRTTQVVRLAIGPDAVAAQINQLLRARKQAALLRRIAAEPTATYLAARLREEYGATALSALADKGLVTLTEESIERRSTHREGGEPSPLPTQAQAAALAKINAAQDDASLSPRIFLLEGVTGSGKTEVYLQAIAHCLSQGRRAIVLVPELSLTPQTVARFEARFPGQVALLHSGLSASRYWQEWWAVQRGQRGIVVGPRSALFAPQPRLGLVVVDEEHEWTYKQVDASPRYHARDVSGELGRLTGAVVVLGSATPDVGTAYAAERGNITRVALPSRIERSGVDTRLPDVRIVDMREELRHGNRSVFSSHLAEALERTIASGHQAILFLNRRGSAGIVECRNCGNVMRCHRCGAPMTLHGTGDSAMLLCHHCNRRRRVPVTCPSCRSPRIRSLGTGTQRLVDGVKELLPTTSVLRWDHDTASTVKAHTELLEAFRSGRADILVGTQMIAKGLDLPSVTLVGVVLADLGLNLPDFRAQERTFQLLTQVAGRAGRGNDPGEVVVQTYQPDHYAIQAAAVQDYAAFYEREIGYRRAHGNPPLTRLIRLLFGHSKQDSARNEAHRLASALRRAARDWDMEDVDIAGPAPAYPPRARNAWRWHLFVRGANPKLLLDKVVVPPGWTVDVDPVNVI